MFINNINNGKNRQWKRKILAVTNSFWGRIIKKWVVLVFLVSISVLVISACDNDSGPMEQINYGDDITVLDLNPDGSRSHLSSAQHTFLHRIEIVRLVIIGELENIVDLVMTVVDVDTNVDVFAEGRPDVDFISNSDVRVFVMVATENNDPLSYIDEELLVSRLLTHLYGLQRENVHIGQMELLNY